MAEAPFQQMAENAALLLAVVVLYDLTMRYRPLVDARLRQLWLGVVLGGLGIGVMLTPWQFAPGILFDTRSVLLAISGLFFGWLPALIVMLMTAFYRMMQGGAFWTDISIIAATGLFGLAWGHYRRRSLVDVSVRELYLFGLGSQALVLVLLLSLPWETAQRVLAAVSLPVLLVYPLATALLGLIMSDRLRRERSLVELRDSEERLRLAVGAANIGFFVRDYRSGHTSCSPELKQQLGYAEAELPVLDPYWTGLIHPQDLALLQSCITDCIRDCGSNYEVQYRLRHKDGTYRWILARGRFYYDEAGQPLRLLGCHVDITRAKQDEAALASSEGRFRSLADSSQDLIILYDRDGRHVYRNPAAERISSRPSGEVLGKTYSEAGFDPAQSAVWEADIRGVFESGKPSQRLVEWNMSSGKVYLDWRLSPVLGLDGAVQWALGISRDVTSLKETELALKKSEELYRVLTENISDVVWVMDVETMMFNYVSPSVERLRGYTPAEIMAQPVYAALTPESAAAVREMNQLRVADHLAGVHPPGYYYISVVEQPCKDGSTVWTEVTTLYYTNPETGKVEVLGVTRDISQRKAAEDENRAAQVELRRLLQEADQSRRALLSMLEDQRQAEEQIRRLNAELERRVHDRTAQLQAANQELEAFAYSVSHDLRAPLRALDGFSAALMEGYTDKLDEQGQHFLVRIQEASRRMGQLINDLLNLSRVTRSELVRQQVDLSSIAQEIAAGLQAQSPEREVKFDIAAGLLVEGDARLLRIVLENLLNNAYKFTSRRPQATITVGRESGGERAYYVRDNGAGFDMAYAGKLFAPFQRLHGMNEFPGTGIGLVTVQRIITRHGGRIWPEAAENSGATFYFTLGGA